MTKSQEEEEQEQQPFWASPGKSQGCAGEAQGRATIKFGDIYLFVYPTGSIKPRNPNRLRTPQKQSFEINFVFIRATRLAHARIVFEYAHTN